jgi:hypothetical protein
VSLPLDITTIVPDLIDSNSFVSKVLWIFDSVSESQYHPEINDTLIYNKNRKKGAAFPLSLKRRGFYAEENLRLCI